ncbi:palmitoyltransferase ZDHHC2/15/20 [Enteropsectra breve]|nr:palmitoyltransferase ZDHHC2/15/20 [Enteropsectra breve]
MEWKKFIHGAIKLCIVFSYPLAEVYAFFVFCGIFCLEGQWVPDAVTVVFFIIYNYLVALKIVYYMQIFIIEGHSTQEIFPYNENREREEDFHNINPFVIDQMRAKSSERAQVCSICKTYKPPRAHHCNSCNRCFLKLDHHCAVFDLCIAFHNYKFFYQFLIANTIGIVYYIAIIFIALFKDAVNYDASVNYIISLSVFGIMLAINTYFLVYHTWLISHNETSIENKTINAYMEGNYTFHHVFQEGPIRTFSNSTDRAILNPYNLGVKQNWAEVFGKEKTGWVRPRFTSIGNGVSFKTNEKEEGEDTLV